MVQGNIERANKQLSLWRLHEGNKGFRERIRLSTRQEEHRPAQPISSILHRRLSRFDLIDGQYLDRNAIFLSLEG